MLKTRAMFCVSIAGTKSIGPFNEDNYINIMWHLSVSRSHGYAPKCYPQLMLAAQFLLHLKTLSLDLTVFFGFLRARFNPAASLCFVSPHYSSRCKSCLQREQSLAKTFSPIEVHVYRPHFTFADVLETKMRSP